MAKVTETDNLSNETKEGVSNSLRCTSSSLSLIQDRFLFFFSAYITSPLLEGDRNEKKKMREKNVGEYVYYCRPKIYALLFFLLTSVVVRVFLNVVSSLI
jgi:hypothetical protein